jgi:hypothetical protein
MRERFIFTTALRQGREDPKDQLAARGRGVDVGTLAGQSLEANAAISASRCRSNTWLPSALEMQAYPMRMSASAVSRP